MKKSNAAAPLAEPESRGEPPTHETLEFPVAEDFISEPPRIATPAMLERIAETMPWRSTRPGERERRSAQAIPVEFKL